MKILLVSLDQYWEDKEKNKFLIESLIKEMDLSEVDMVVFPEMTLTGFSVENPKSLAENIQDSPTINWFKDFSVKNKVVSVFGMIVEHDGKYTNSAIAVSQHGEIMAKYDKIHSFSYSKENVHFQSGTELNSFFYKINIGLSICYDLRFPYLYQNYSNTCAAIINIANWPSNRIEHWKTLLKARAIENQCFIIAINRIGEDKNGLKYLKSSFVISPWGEVISPLYTDESLDLIEINESEPNRIRKEFPFLNDRKKL